MIMIVLLCMEIMIDSNYPLVSRGNWKELGNLIKSRESSGQWLVMLLGKCQTLQSGSPTDTRWCSPSYVSFKLANSGEPLCTDCNYICATFYKIRYVHLEKWDDSKIIQDVVSAVTALKCNLKGGRDAPLSLSSTEAVGSTLDRNSSSFAGKVQCQFWPFPIPNRKNLYPQHEQIQYISTFSTFWGKKSSSFSIFTYHNIYIYIHTAYILYIHTNLGEGLTSLLSAPNFLTKRGHQIHPVQFPHGLIAITWSKYTISGQR